MMSFCIVSEPGVRLSDFEQGLDNNSWRNKAMTDASTYRTVKHELNHLRN